MGIEKRKQSTRLIFLFIYIFLLFVINKLTFGSWTPESAEKGLWFYTAAASILLGNFLVTPFFTKPVDALSYSVMAGTGIFLVNSLDTWELMDRVVFWTTCLFIVIVLLSALTSIATKDSGKEFWKRISATSMIISNSLGNHRVIFSSVFLFALVVFHRQSSKEMFFLSITWALLVVIEPDKHLWNLIQRIRQIWYKDELVSIIGKITAYQSPKIILLKQSEGVYTKFGTLIAFKDSHSVVKIGLVLNYVGRDETLLLRAIEIDTNENANKEAGRLIKKESGNTAIKFQYFDLNPAGKKDIPELFQINELVGIVDQQTSIERLEFEIIKANDISEGRLVEVEINGQQVIYQIMDGLTKEDIVSQKNKYGYARGTAYKIGRWNSEKKKFESVQWLPDINTPVYLKTSKVPVPDLLTVGHFPKTNYNVRINSISDLVTHNTAILGILGIGKSMLAIELVERMIAEGIKVICIDLTNQYAQELSDFHDPIWSNSCIEKIHKAGEYNVSAINNNPQDGGSLPHLTQALEYDIKDFIHNDNEHFLKIYNPTELTGTKQTSEIRSISEEGKWISRAPLWDLTPVEITSLITEATLKFVQNEMSSTARVCIIFEEAHSLVPEWSSAANEGDKSATNRTARAILQGRKYGLGCLLITQRTANVTKTILNQCNSIFAMRTFDDTGKSFLANYIGSEYSSKLSSLEARHAVYYGKSSSCENPVLLKLNDRQDFVKVFRAKYKPLKFKDSKKTQREPSKKKGEESRIIKPKETSIKDSDLDVEGKQRDAPEDKPDQTSALDKIQRDSLKDKTNQISPLDKIQRDSLKDKTNQISPLDEIQIEKITSKLNPEQTNDLKIGFDINQIFTQEEPHKYPVVKIPTKDSFLKLPRNGRSKQRGYKEADFFKLIQTEIPELESNVESHLAIPFLNRPYEPDIVLFDKKYNLCVDIEIDEPYDGYYRYPTHEEGKDTTRDLFFTESGWVVIRFTEKQVHEQENECIDFIKDVLKSIYENREVRTSTLQDVAQWDSQQAIRWEKEFYREKYLGIDQFGKVINTKEIIVDPEEIDLIENEIKRTEIFKSDVKDFDISFDEITHTYRHPNDTTGNASFISVTTLIDRFFPFDLDSFIQKKVIKEGRTEEQVLEEFIKNREEAAEKGTYLHEQIENFLEGRQYDGAFKEFEYFIEFYQEVIVSKGFEFVEAEKKILSKEYNVSGTIDVLFKKPNNDDYIIIDWKRSKKLVIDGHPKMYGFGFGLSELSHLDNSSYYKYSLQQNIYKYILEQSEGVKISSMKLLVLHPEHSKYYLISLDNMEKEVKSVLESTKHKI